MKINVASLITDTQIQSNPTTQLPTGFTGDLATNYTQIKNYILNQIGFAPLFDTSTKGQGTDLNAVNLSSMEAAGYLTSGLFEPRSNCTNGPIALAGEMLWLRGTLNEQTQIFNSTAGVLYYRKKTGGVWGSWKTITTNTDVTSGTYTPTLTNTTNVSSSSAVACNYMKVYSVVTVSGTVDITPTSGASVTTFLNMSLPIASNFTLVSQAGGTAIDAFSSQYAEIGADTVNDNASFQFKSTTTSGRTFYFSFTYLIN